MAILGNFSLKVAIKTTKRQEKGCMSAMLNRNGAESRNKKTYLRVASALSMVTLSSVASRLRRPRS